MKGPPLVSHARVPSPAVPAALAQRPLTVSSDGGGCHHVRGIKGDLPREPGSGCSSLEQLLRKGEAPGFARRGSVSPADSPTE